MKVLSACVENTYYVDFDMGGWTLRLIRKADGLWYEEGLSGMERIENQQEIEEIWFNWEVKEARFDREEK